MANPVWPTELQQLVNIDNFIFSPGPTVLRSENAIGPAKLRRLSTRSVDPLSFSIFLPLTQYSVLDVFYRTTVNAGVTPFTFTHPITRSPVTVRFVDPPRYRPLGGAVFEVAINLEVMP